MSEIVAVVLDLAKNLFQMLWADAAGVAVLRKKLQRLQVPASYEVMPPWVVAIEACGAANYRGREIGTLGHEVRMIPPA